MTYFYKTNQAPTMAQISNYLKGERKMKKYTAIILLVMLFLASFVATTPFVEVMAEEPDYNWMQKVDKDLLKKMSNGDEIPGDINGDGIVDIADLTIVALAYGQFEGEPGYNPDADLNKDGIIDLTDISIVTMNYGESW